MKYFLLFLLSFSSLAKLQVVTTTTNLEALVKEVGKDRVEVVSLSKGSQDPHFLEAKPSFMVKASRADLLVQVGLGLESGWLPLIIRGARNPDLRPGKKGHFFASSKVNLIEQVEEVTRADGDVHPEGNPHFMLDPIIAGDVGVRLAKKLGDLDNENKDFYLNNAKAFKEEMRTLFLKGNKLLAGKNKKIITYHKTLNYFNKRFGLKNLAYLEPKPGVPPSASHILKVIKKAKELNPKHILIENYFDPTVGKRVMKELKSSELHFIPVAVRGDKGVESLGDLYKKLILIISDEDVWK